MRLYLFSLFSVITAIGHAEENVEYFEKRYGTKIEDVKPIESYSDPDEFYSEIARQLGIPQLAFDTVAKKYGWTPGPSRQQQGIVRRSEQKWIVLIFQISIDEKTSKPLRETMASRFVEIDDDKKVLFCGEEQPGKTAEPGSQ